jgi:hypothetical protein
VSCIDTFKPTWDNHIPVKPATKKKKIYETIHNKAASIFNAPFANVKVQFTTLIVAGKEIIIVIVLYIVLLL